MLHERFLAPENLYTQLEEAFNENDFEKIQKLSEDCTEDRRRVLFYNYVRRSRNYRILDCILTYFSFSERLKEEIPYMTIVFDNLPVFERLVNKYGLLSKNFLNYAIRCSAVMIIRYLISKKEGFELSNAKEGFDLIVLAETEFYPTTARVLIDIFEKSGLDIFSHLRNKPDHPDWKVLWEAAFLNEDFYLLDLIISMGADINHIVDESKILTPIQLAIEERNLNLLKYIVEKGASLNPTDDQISRGYVSPLYRLAGLCCTLILDLDLLRQGAQILVRYGADPKFHDKYGTEIETLIKSKIEDHHETEGPWTDENGDVLSKEQALQNALSDFRAGVKEGLRNRLKTCVS